MDSASGNLAVQAPLASFRGRPYAALAELDRRLQAGTYEAGLGEAVDTWVGLGFRLGAQWYLAPQQEVREVIPTPHYTRVPNARGWLLGVANVRGNLLPLADLSQLIGGPPAVMTRESRFLVLNSDEVPVGFLVDAATGYRRFLAEDQSHGLVAAQSADSQPFLLGAFEREGDPWLVFSLLKLIRSEQFSSAAGG